MLRLAPWSVLLALATCGLAACGPSVQAVYESSVRFEHCNRLDLDPEITPTHRLACWRDWLARHTVGQTDDRLDYARQRVGELTAGETGTLTLDLDAGADGAAPDAPPRAAPVGSATPTPSGSAPSPPASAAPSPTGGASAAPPRTPRRRAE